VFAVVDSLVEVGVLHMAEEDTLDILVVVVEDCCIVVVAGTVEVVRIVVVAVDMEV